MRFYYTTLFCACLITSLNTFALENTKTHYDWLSKNEITGRLTIDKTGPDTRSAIFTFRIAGYGPNILEEYQINKAGFVTNLKISGTSYFGLTLNEEFSLHNNLAKWHSTTEQGSEVLIKSKPYFPNQGTLASWAELIRYTYKKPQQSIELLPQGKLKVNKLVTIPITLGSKKKSVSLYSASGFDFSPEYIWLDEQLNLFAASYDNRWGALILKDWQPTLSKLQDAQEKIEQDYWHALAKKHSHKLKKPLLIKNVNLFDSKNATVLAGYDVLINKGIIQKISKQLPTKNHYKTIDASGKTLLPGLWDMHSHANLEDGILNIAAGVTNLRDLGNHNDDIQGIIKSFNTNSYIGPRIYPAGFIDQKSEREINIGKVVDTLEQALEAVNWYADQNYQQIKLYSSITPEWVKPMTKAAKERGLRVSGHIPAFMNAEQAIYSGYNEIQHMTMIFLNFLVNSKTDTRTGIRFTAVAEKASKLNLNSKAVREFIDLLKRKKIIVDPTLAGYTAMLTQQSGQMDPRYQSIASHFPPSVYRNFLNAEMDVNENNALDYRASAQALKAMLKKLYDNEIQLVAGTDAMPGFTLHSELEAFVEAGIPNARVLQIATLDAARIMKADQSLGSIEAGKLSDIILVEGNPIEDISVIRKISFVLKGDTAFLPDELYRAIGVKPFTQSERID